MPNWCSNVAQISHDDKFEIDKIENELAKKDNCQLFNSLVTRPISEEENWYGWNVENWGTKWDAGVNYWERIDENTIMIEFDTAWSPPVEFYSTLYQENYQIDAQYYEPGMGFCGEFSSGMDNFYEYDITDRETWENIPADLVEFAGLEFDYETYKDDE